MMKLFGKNLLKPPRSQAVLKLLNTSFSGTAQKPRERISLLVRKEVITVEIMGISQSKVRRARTKKRTTFQGERKKLRAVIIHP